MRRGAKPAKAKVQAKSPGARKSAKNQGSTGPELEKRLAEAVKPSRRRPQKSSA